jgi:hypothetical protein
MGRMLGGRDGARPSIVGASVCRCVGASVRRCVGMSVPAVWGENKLQMRPAGALEGRAPARPDTRERVPPNPGCQKSLGMGSGKGTRRSPAAAGSRRQERQGCHPFRRRFRFSAIDLRPSTFSAIDLRPSTFSAIDLRPSTFSAIDLRPSTFSAIDPRPSTFDQAGGYGAGGVNRKVQTPGLAGA